MYVVSLSNSCFLLLTSLFKYSWKESACMEFENIKLYNCVMHFLHCQDGTYYLRLASGFVSVSLKGLMLDWNCCLSTNNSTWNWAYLCCNLQPCVFFIVIEIRHWTKASFCDQVDYFHWIVDKIPDLSILNTAGCRYIVPKLYKQYCAICWFKR